MPPLKSVAIAPGAYSDAAPSQFLCQVPCQNLDGSLHGRVWGTSWDRDTGQARRKIHDLPPVIDERQKLLLEEEDALEVDTKKAVELRLGRLIDRIVVRDSGIVDKVIETLGSPVPQGGADPIHECVERADIAGIELQADRLCAAFADSRGNFVRICSIGVVGEDCVDAALG
jgi:hypothetical protein